MTANSPGICEMSTPQHMYYSNDGTTFQRKRLLKVVD